MNRTLQAMVMVATLGFFLYRVNTGIYQAERTLSQGEVVYLELAPVDPRSLIQGDYMALDYALERDLFSIVNEVKRGQVVVRLDEERVARFVRLHQGEPLASDERLIQFRGISNGNVRVGVDSFFFQEGLGEVYADARYAETRLTTQGTVMLVELVDENRQRFTFP